MAEPGWDNAELRAWSDVASRFGVTERHRFVGLPVVELEGGLLVVRALTPEARGRALRGLERLDPQHALQVPTAMFEHTRRMRFEVDLIWLDMHDEVIRVDRTVPPGRVRLCTAARSVVETVAGRAGAFLAAGLGCRPHAGGAPPSAQGWLPAGSTWVPWSRIWRRT